MVLSFDLASTQGHTRSRLQRVILPSLSLSSCASPPHYRVSFFLSLSPFLLSCIPQSLLMPSLLPRSVPPCYPASSLLSLSLSPYLLSLPLLLPFPSPLPPLPPLPFTSVTAQRRERLGAAGKNLKRKLNRDTL